MAHVLVSIRAANAAIAAGRELVVDPFGSIT